MNQKKDKKEVVSRVILFFSFGVVSLAMIFILISLVHPIDLTNYAISSSFKMLALKDANHPFINNIAKSCYLYEPETQVECVISQVGKYYLLNESRQSKYHIQSVDEFLISESLCRDIAVIYHNIFIKQGWLVEFNFMPEHVYIDLYKKINDKAYRCEVDNLKHLCVAYGG